ncbi:hypothetical protein BGZ80_003562 [Entomortierella chlamydospora]|uniref:Carboxylesterase type B domain-containing protein n=1 Tax=Entomortierella chlamydospora TaxID=101097 RepID=A0A9P6T2T5_9FUNG|nr:hypothetical protein BGZ79_006743 [Entomortierella chlamydospora]KAG0020804.1 hypothetical protein BGZ80_003562 [Entomortierella chlamydospora]
MAVLKSILLALAAILVTFQLSDAGPHLPMATGNLESIPCGANLPVICQNTAPRRRLLLEDTSRQITVQTSVGNILGWRNQNSFRFLCISYGEAPVGELGFGTPVAKAPFNGTWSAINYKAICPQLPGSTNFTTISQTFVENDRAKGQEDCLHLNVYTPSIKGTGETGLPVMVHIHEGSYISGSGGYVTLDPGNMVSRGGVVSVSINYRLGLLGFMENGPAWPRSSARSCRR